MGRIAALACRERPSACTGAKLRLRAQAGGEKAKARDILAAIRTLKTIEAEQRQVLGRFGPVALHIFPDPVTGRYKDGTVIRRMPNPAK